MGKRPDTPLEVSRLFIPERHLWTDEAAERFLDDDGNLRRQSDGTFDFEPIEKPLIDPVEIPVVDIPGYARTIRGLFKPDSRIPRIYRKDISNTLASKGIHASNNFIDLMVSDNREHVQQQKLYKEQGRIVDASAFRFCDLPERSFRLQWLIHNAVTHVFADAPVPDRDVRDAHRKGAELSLDVLDLAIMMRRRGQPVNSRLSDIREGRVLPEKLKKQTNIDLSGITAEEVFMQDEEASDYFKSMSSKVKDEWKRRLDNYANNVPEESYFGLFKNVVLESKPKAVVTFLGSIATRDPWSLSPYFSGRMSLENARKVHRNRYARRVANDSRLVA